MQLRCFSNVNGPFNFPDLINMIIEGKITCIRNYKDKYVVKTMDITSAECNIY